MRREISPEGARFPNAWRSPVNLRSGREHSPEGARSLNSWRSPEESGPAESIALKGRHLLTPGEARRNPDATEDQP